MMNIVAAIHNKLLALKPTVVENGDLRFLCHNTEEITRAKTAYTKEPITTGWISKLGRGCLFLDVGANVGIYSLMAASRGADVYAFEPHFQNYYSLNMNLKLNGLDRTARAFCLGVGGQRSVETFFHFKFTAGSSTSQMSQAVDDTGRSFTPAFEQGIFSVTLDDLHTHLPIARATEVHLKIDVDGLEGAILTASRGMLAEPKLRSLLVELAPTEAGPLSAHLGAFGFRIEAEEPSNRKKSSSPINYLFRKQ
jgi:FkbM family methyltransferase